ncbi:MAG TPA: CshA/CshB family fibrillar adhesin-related protein, partial [Chitinophagaceae bacterium]|nr:CshA/CshB family fibrillar adhesin-related protein [Chitinophagaceae bacterium]
MKRTILCLAIFAAIVSNAHSQYADLGTGALKNQIWWFDWNNFTVADGASRSFTTGDGLTVTITFSNVQGPVFQPYVMNTWVGAVLHYLYDFSNVNIKPALFSTYTTLNSQFTISVTATRNGAPAPFKFIAADAEASATSEIMTLTTSGSNWLCVDFFRNSTQTTNPFTGCNTQTANVTDTWGGGLSGIGQNPVIATDNAGGSPLVLNCSFNRNSVIGQMGIALGIFGSVDMGDLPASYGNAQHTLKYTTNNPCNYLPPLPS